MAQFKDLHNREWILRVDAWAVREVKRETDCLLTAIADDDFALLQELSNDRDPTLLVTVLWVLIRDQAAERSIDERNFGMGLGGDALRAARDALLQAIIDFFSDPAQRRALTTLIEKARATGDILARHLETKLAEIDPAQLAQTTIGASSKRPASRA